MTNCTPVSYTHLDVYKRQPTPSQTISPSDNYHAGEDGQVEDGTYHTGSPGEDIGDAVDDAGDAVKDIADDAGKAVEKAGDALTGQR